MALRKLTRKSWLELEDMRAYHVIAVRKERKVEVR